MDDYFETMIARRWAVRDKLFSLSLSFLDSTSLLLEIELENASLYVRPFLHSFSAWAS